MTLLPVASSGELRTRSPRTPAFSTHRAQNEKKPDPGDDVLRHIFDLGSRESGTQSVVRTAVWRQFLGASRRRSGGSCRHVPDIVSAEARWQLGNERVCGAEVVMLHRVARPRTRRPGAFELVGTPQALIEAANAAVAQSVRDAEVQRALVKNRGIAIGDLRAVFAWEVQTGAAKCRGIITSASIRSTRSSRDV